MKLKKKIFFKTFGPISAWHKTFLVKEDSSLFKLGLRPWVKGN